MSPGSRPRRAVWITSTLSTGSAREGVPSRETVSALGFLPPEGWGARVDGGPVRGRRGFDLADHPRRPV